jgi:hypothetical protein
MGITITTKLKDGLEVPFIYDIQNYEQAFKLIQDSIDLGADITEVLIK